MASKTAFNMKALLFLTACAVAAGQNFGEARMRKSAQLTPQTMGSIGLRVTDARVNIGYASLRDLAAMAYEVEPARVSGPDWIGQQRYDIQALMPAGADERQVPAMLRSLLRDRFKLVAHSENREEQVYLLTIADGGHKLQPAPPQEPQAGVAGAPGQNFTPSPDGGMRLEFERVTMPKLAEGLRLYSDLAVMDRTNLSGEFQLSLQLSPAVVLSSALRIASTVPNGGIVAGAAKAGLAGLPAPDPAGVLAKAIAQLGLRLDKQQASLPTLVIESADRNPREE